MYDHVFQSHYKTTQAWTVEDSGVGYVAVCLVYYLFYGLASTSALVSAGGASTLVSAGCSSALVSTGGTSVTSVLVSAGGYTTFV
jgi:hypothetical protein